MNGINNKKRTTLLVGLLFIIFAVGTVYAVQTDQLVFQSTVTLPSGLPITRNMRVELIPHADGNHFVANGWGDEIDADITFNGDNTATVTVDFSGMSAATLADSRMAEVQLYFDVVNNGDVDVLFQQPAAATLPDNAHGLMVFFADAPNNERLNSGQQWGRRGVIFVRLSNYFTPRPEPFEFVLTIPFVEAA